MNGRLFRRSAAPAASVSSHDRQEKEADQDAEARSFRHRHVERGVLARAGLPADTLVLPGDQHTPAELADLVLKSVAPGRTGT
jgi:hypothetical protein